MTDKYKKIDEKIKKHFDNISNKELLKNLHKAGIDFYQDINGKSIDKNIKKLSGCSSVW